MFRDLLFQEHVLSHSYLLSYLPSLIEIYIVPISNDIYSFNLQFLFPFFSISTCLNYRFYFIELRLTGFNTIDPFLRLLSYLIQ